MATDSTDMSPADDPRSTGARSYDIRIRRGLLKDLGAEPTRLGRSGKVGVVTDRNLAGHYLKPVMRVTGVRFHGCADHLCRPVSASKTPAPIEKVMDALVDARFERSSTLLALEGGVIGDLTGFAAAIYQRGIPLCKSRRVSLRKWTRVGGKTEWIIQREEPIGAFNQPSGRTD